MFPLVAATAERALEIFGRRPGHAPLEEEDRDDRDFRDSRDEEGKEEEKAVAPPPAPQQPAASPLRSVFTSSLPAVLRQLGSSLLVSTYQSGRVVVVRADGEALNTHFRSFPSPMGLALGPRYLAIGTARCVWEYRNVPAAARRLTPAGKHDACFLPRACHVTGDVRVHDMAFAGGELWVVNTRFSSLCVLDRDHSFVPRWRPPFVSALVPEDRCHLNGLAVVEERPAYVTALGVSDTAEGWREGKAHGGVLLDVASGEVVAGGLSMPHSPRWHDGRLWVLESGKGEIGVVDLARGRVETVARLPGFTRGLCFAGPYAFVGLSQVRESVFAGIPLGERLKERVCGVWTIDLRSGATAGFLRFEDAVQEIFEVALLPGLRFPELTEPEDDLTASTYVVPDAALPEVTGPRRS
ncbi:MAG TPA: TIGR03032 family protein [Thermoanaerobaculia bacterium]|nr:TIGR03032 family protein [Thermoanaerobaculia bacterium]